MDQDKLANVPEHAKAGLAKMNASASFSSRPITEQRAIIEQTLQRALQDEHLADIAASFGLARSVLNYHLLADASDDWKDVQVARALTAKQDAQRELDAAQDGLTLARGRERLKSAQWELEKLYRRLYGDDKTAINVNAAGAVSIQVVSFAEQNPAIDAAQQVQRSMDSQVIEGEKG